MNPRLILSAISMFTLLFTSVQSSAAQEGRIRIDGSSTVFPITEAVAEEFAKKSPKVRVIVGTSGTGGGFKKFAMGEVDINNASRTIKDTEAKLAATKGIQPIAVPVAHDGITLVVNKENTWVDKLTVAELKKIWGPDSTVKTWKDIRPEWPDRKILLYGPGTDSGTFDFFTEAINGKSQVSRSEFTKSEDDNVLVQGVEGNRDALGYFGFAYYVSNKDRLKVVPVDSGKGAITPSLETINNETYSPLSRTVYIYVSSKSVTRPEVQEFVRFYITEAANLVTEVGYVPLAKDKYTAARTEFDKVVGLASKVTKK
jgi:phosphate transport system substrate-binding protein